MRWRDHTDPQGKGDVTAGRNVRPVVRTVSACPHQRCGEPRHRCPSQAPCYTSPRPYAERHQRHLRPLISYLVPGVTALLGLSPFIPAVQEWFAATPDNAPTIGGFLYLTVAAFGTGMILSAVRWAFLDALHARTGLLPPPRDFSRLGSNVEAMRLLIEIHYRHYLFFGNELVAVIVAWAAHRTAVGWTAAAGLLDVAVFVLVPILFAASRDTLRNYYERTSQLLARPTSSSPTPSRAARRTPGASSRGQ